jgi:23S rRNA pseudouridine2457 synthase
VIIRFYKPFNVLPSFTDPDGLNRATLADYLPYRRVYAAGRLDFDSEGLLILTDEGALNHRLTSPEYHHPKTYLVQVENIPNEAALNRLRSGVEIQGYQTRPATVELLTTDPDLPPRDPPIRYRKAIPTAWLRLTLTEGKNRQVRRMTAAIGHPTLRLVRIAVATLSLEGLAVGEHALLSPMETRAVWKFVKK